MMRLLVWVAGFFVVSGAMCSAQMMCNGQADVQPQDGWVNYSPEPTMLNVWVVRKNANRDAKIQLDFMDHKARYGKFVNPTLVDETELLDKIRSTERTDAYPDELYFESGIPVYWPSRRDGLEAEFVDGKLRPPVSQIVVQKLPDPVTFNPSVVILARAPHLLAAVEDRVLKGAVSHDEVPQGTLDAHNHAGHSWPSSEVAARALRDVMHGQEMGEDADPEMLRIDAESVRDVTFEAEEGVEASSMTSETCVIDALGGDRLSVVALRTYFAGGGKYGVLRSLMVMRPSPEPTPRWRVLQLTLDLTPSAVTQAMDELSPYVGEKDPPPYVQKAERHRSAARLRASNSPAPAADSPAASSVLGQRKMQAVSMMAEAPLGIASPASPADGDSRPYRPRPELWIDPAGSASRMLLVEWQAWADEQLTSYPFFVHDVDPKLVTRVSAPFDTVVGEVRWRVWAFSPGGQMTISPWRTVNLHE